MLSTALNSLYDQLIFHKFNGNFLYFFKIAFWQNYKVAVWSFRDEVDKKAKKTCQTICENEF